MKGCKAISDWASALSQKVRRRYGHDSHRKSIVALSGVWAGDHFSIFEIGLPAFCGSLARLSHDPGLKAFFMMFHADTPAASPFFSLVFLSFDHHLPNRSG